MIKLYLLSGLVFLCEIVYAQEIQNIRFEENGTKITIYYDLVGGKKCQLFDVEVYAGFSEVLSFRGPLKNVEGAVGKEQVGGVNQRIDWFCLEEFDTDEFKARLGIKLKVTVNYDESCDINENIDIQWTDTLEQSPYSYLVVAYRKISERSLLIDTLKLFSTYPGAISWCDTVQQPQGNYWVICCEKRPGTPVVARDTIRSLPSFYSHNHSQPARTLLDPRDGKKYRTVKIGNQVWMAENLNYDLGEGCYCYNKQEKNCETYGRLYTWKHAQQACPSGWHLPSDKEWTILEVRFGLKVREAVTKRRGQHGELMKLAEAWNDGTRENRVRFDVLPAGVHIANSFGGLGARTIFWSSTKDENLGVWSRSFDNFSNYVSREYLYSETSGFSCRCVKD